MTPKADQEKTGQDNVRQLVGDQDFQDEEESLPVRGQEEELPLHRTKSHIPLLDDDDPPIQVSNNPFQDNSIMTKGHIQLSDDDDLFTRDNSKNPDQDKTYSMNQGSGYQTQPRGSNNDREPPSNYQRKPLGVLDQKHGSRQREMSQREEEEGIGTKGGFNNEQRDDRTQWSRHRGETIQGEGGKLRGGFTKGQGRRDDNLQGSRHWREEELRQRGINNQEQSRGYQQQSYGAHDQRNGRQAPEHTQNGRAPRHNQREDRTGIDDFHRSHERQNEEDHHPGNRRQAGDHYESEPDQQPGYYERGRETDPRPRPTGRNGYLDRNDHLRGYETRNEYGRDEFQRRRQFIGEDQIRAKIFHGKEGEDLEMFIDLIDLTFREDKYEERMRERMKILYLASHLEDEAQNWWSKLDPDRKRTWVEAISALKFKYNRATMRMSTERLERQRAQVALNNLRQGDMTCEEYLNTADDMYYRLGTSYDRTLAMNFVQGISNPVIQSVVNGLVMDNFSYEQVQEAFIRATRCQRETEMQKKMDDKGKVDTRDESLTKTLLEVQVNMAKMMLDNQRMMAMMLENQDARFSKGTNISQDSTMKPVVQEGVTCYGCGQKGHYKNECTANVQSNRQQWRPQNSGRFMVGAKAGSTEVSTNAVSTGEEGIVIYRDNEGSGTLGMRVASNMVELINEVINGRTEEEVAVVSKRNRESSSSGRAADSERPVPKRPRAEPDQQIGGNQDRPIKIPITRRRENEDITQENTLPMLRRQGNRGN